MATVATKPLTAEEFHDLPDPPDGKLELVRGEIVVMCRPGLRHGETQLAIGSLIRTFAKERGLGRAFVESGVLTERDPDTVRGPDVSFYSAARLPLDRDVVKYNDLPPDLCVEVVSPFDVRRELREKVEEYFAAGVRMVWVVDPEDRSVTVLTQPDEGRTLYGKSVLDGGEVLPGFSCPVAELFA
jgi:Uma2 family endonuclease